LENKPVRQLLITGKGNDDVYAGLNLKGAYLVGASLTHADLRETDLSGSTLENVSLRDANLVRASVIDVELKGADLTGSCLESWNIDSTTSFEGAHADYVYLLSDKQERRPSSGTFGEGEFSKLFQEFLDTVDLIFKNGIDWQAFIVSLDKLKEKIKIENDKGEVSVQSIENKGDGVFVVRLNVPPDSDKEKIHSEFTQEYDEQIKVIEEKYRLLLEHKENEIKNRERVIEKLLKKKAKEAQVKAQIVRVNRRKPLPDRNGDGRYSLPGAARRFGVTESVMRGWVRKGWVSGRKENYNDHRGIWWLDIDEATAARLEKEAEKAQARKTLSKKIQ